MRALIVGFALVGVAACDQLNFSRESRGGNSLVSESGGEIMLADGGSLEFGITSEQYKRWDKARKGITRQVAARFGTILQPDAPTERSIEQAVAYLDSEPAARASIEAAGMSTRAFVIMTVALEQEMRRASGQPAVRQPDPMPVPYDFPLVDTTMISPQPIPYPVDTFTRIPPGTTAVPVDTALMVPPVTPRVRTADPMRDTVISPTPRVAPLPRDTLSPAPTIFRRDTARRARPTPRPDSSRRDTARPPEPPPADTGSGPAAPAPAQPDTLPIS